MGKSLDTDWPTPDGHPSEDELLLYVDGELAAKEAGNMRAHLEACWSCRVRTEKIQEAISSFIDYRNHVLKPLIQPPPHGWRGFDGKLNRLATQVGKQSLLAKFTGSMGRFLPVTRFISQRTSLSPVRDEIFIEPHRPFSSSPFRGGMLLLKELTMRLRPGTINMTLLRSLLFGTPFRITATLVVIGLITTLALLLRHEPVVSAGELLKNATEAQAKQIRGTAEPVVYQKLQVRRKDPASQRAETVHLEIWNDAANSRFRQSLTDGGARQFIPAAADQGDAEIGSSGDTASPSSSPRPRVPGSLRLDIPAVLLELGHVLRVNQMDPQRPLSPISYQAWRNSLSEKHEEVTKSSFAGGVEALTLRTVPAGPIEVGRIAEAALVVRARDWHPGALRLRVRAEGGDLEYELVETSFEVVSLPALSPEIFPERPVLSPSASTPERAEIVKTEPVPASPAPDPRSPTPSAATAELEVEVLRLLNQAGADLGEQVSAARTVEGILQVTGIVETEQRKTEILRALAPVMEHPAVRVEIKTVAEAVAQQQGRRTGAETSAATTQKVEIASDAIAAEGELRSYFARQGERADEAARQFAARMVSRSRRAMSHVYALKRLLGQFSTEELRTLSPEARNKWLALVRSHARAYRAEAEGLRRELQPIFFPQFTVGPEAATQGGAETTDDARVLRAIERIAQLVELASANDRVIRSAFAASTEAATTTAIKTPQFWQSLRSAEAVAQSISRSH